MAKLLKASPGQIVIIQPEKFRSKYEPASHTVTVKVLHFYYNRLDFDYSAVFKVSESISQESTAVSEVQDFFKDHVIPLVGHRKPSNDAKRYAKRPLVVVYYGVDFSFDYRKGKSQQPPVGDKHL